MSAISSPIRVRIDTELDQLQRHRQRVVAEAPSARRSTRIAELYEREARLWSVLFENTRIRVHWRAALAAEVHARQCARQWRRRAAAEASKRRHSLRFGMSCGELGERAERWQADTAGGAA